MAHPIRSRAGRGRGRGADRGHHRGRRVWSGARCRRGTRGAVAARTGPARPHASHRRAGPPRAGREDTPVHRLDAREDVPRAAAVRPAATGPAAALERPARPRLHRESRGHEALPAEHPRAGYRGDRSRRRAHRGHRRADPGRPAQGGPAPVQRRPRRRPATHPARHRRGPRGAELPGPLCRPLPLRPAVEPRPHRAAQRPHRPQAAAGGRGALPLLRAAAARRGQGAGGARLQDRDHQARAGQPVEGHRRRCRAPAAGRHPPPGRRPAEARYREG